MDKVELLNWLEKAWEAYEADTVHGLYNEFRSMAEALPEPERGREGND